MEHSPDSPADTSTNEGTGGVLIEISEVNDGAAGADDLTNESEGDRIILETQGEGESSGPGNDREAEVEAVGWYSSQPCSSSSSAAFVTDALPFQIPKVDLVEEDAIDVIDVPAPVAEHSLATSTDYDHVDISEVEEIGRVIYNDHGVVYAECTIETSPAEDVQIDLTVKGINASKKSSDTDTAKKCTDPNGYEANVAAEDCSNKTLPETVVLAGSSSRKDSLATMLIDIADDAEKIKDKTRKATIRAVPRKSTFGCFNCQGNHFVDSCPEELDQFLIHQRRREFRAKNMCTPTSGGRYYNYKKMDDKYDSSKFTPGMVSESLRHAMGLRPNQLPLHIYNMRNVGYPPGWIDEAVEAVEEPASGSKSCVGSEEPPRSLSLSKLHEYPGFTTPVPIGFKDEGHLFDNDHNYTSTLEDIKNDFDVREAQRCQSEPSSSAASPLIVRNPLCKTSEAGRVTSNEATENNAWYAGITDPEPYLASGRGLSTIERKNTEDGVNKLWIRNACGKLELSPHVKSVAEYKGATRNYHVTAELERRQEEEEKRKLEELAGKKQDDSSGSDYYRKRSTSPSTINYCATIKSTQRQKNAKRSRAIPKATVVDDADVIILEDGKSKDQQSKPDASKGEPEIIELDCDSQPASPPSKKPKMSTDSQSHEDEDAGDSVIMTE